MATLHVYGNGAWRGLCTGDTVRVWTGSQWEQVKAGDYIRASGAWQELCPVPDPNYPFGFDYVNRLVTITPPDDAHHVIDFENSSNDYPWGGANDFILRCFLDVDIGAGGNESVEVRGHAPNGSIVWMFGPQTSEGIYNQIYDFPMNAANYLMRIHAFFTLGSSFTITTQVLSGGSPFIDFSGIPFPTDYDSTD